MTKVAGLRSAVRESGRPNRRTRPALLLALTVLPVLAEAVVLRGTGFVSALGLAGQVSAPSPFGVFHDLRWVLVYHDSWWAFAWESVAAIVVRSVLNTTIVSLAWPEDVPRRPWWRLLRFNLLFTLIVYVMLSPWAAVAVAGSDTSLFWFVLGEVVPLLFLSLVLQRGGVVAGWWRDMPSPREVGWSLVSFVALTLDALLIYSAPGWWRVPVAVATGVVNAGLWRGLVRSALRARPSRHIVPAVPIALVISAGALLAMGQFSAIGGAVASVPPAHIQQLGHGIGQDIIYVAGYDSKLSPASAASDVDGVPVRHFSYRGLAPDGRPLPYGQDATWQSLPASAALLAQQVDDLHRRTGRRIALVAQSEGTLVARTYLMDFPHQAVDDVVLLSPLVQPGRVYFPPPQASSGWGIATGWLLRGMFAVVRSTSSSQVSPDEPFVRSVLDHAATYRSGILCPAPGVRTIAFVPFTEAAVSPPDHFAGIPVIELPGLHAGLLGEPEVQHSIIALLQGRSPGSEPGAGYAVIQRAAAAWQAPALALRLNPVWHADDRPDPSFGQPACG